MRTISKYISFALMAFAVVACHTNNIDNPDNPDNPNPPQISDNVTFTASIKQTRVEYTPNGDKLDQYWKKNDVIYGFYGEGSGSKIILQVTGVDSNGYAKLEPLYDTGPAFVAALKESVKNKKTLGIGLIYTGKTNISEGSYSNSISIGDSFSDQSTGQIPACMSCILYDDSKTDEDGNTIVEFEFKNDCAILEIKGITGAKEEANLSDGGKAELISITVTNTCYYFKYSYDSGALSLDINTDYLWDTCVEPESLYIDSNGNIVDSYGNSASVMIAVVPNDFKKDINVTAKISGGKTFGSSYNTAFAAGTCYIINAKPAVAKTEDGLYFSSVAGAFRRAKYLDGHRDLLNGKTNTVTLVKDYIDGLKEDVAHDTEESYDPKIIQIDYPVTLDLNGCSLSLDCNSNLCEWDSFYSGGFEVESGGTLTIDDSKGSGCVDSGSKINEEGIPIITSSGTGTVNILGGSLCHWESGQAIKSTGGTVNVSGGRVYAWGNSAIHISDSGTEGFISGGLVGNKSDLYECIIVQDGAECSISGGTIYSRGGSSTVACRSYGTNVSKLYITWPIENTDDEIPDHEPLIYSCYKEYPASPLTAAYCGPVTGEKVNTAQVFIQGGFLLTHSQSDDRGTYFYQDDNTTQSTFENLIISSCGDFYANTSEMNSNGSSNITVELYDTDSDKYKSYFKVTDCSSDAYTPEFLFDYLDKEDFYNKVFPTETELYFFEKL